MGRTLLTHHAAETNNSYLHDSHGPLGDEKIDVILTQALA